MKRLIVLLNLLLMLVVCAKVQAGNNNIYTEEQTSITVTKKQPVFVLKLASNPTTGYSWAMSEHTKAIKMVKHKYLPSKSMLMGAGGFEWWTFRVTPAGFSVKKPIPVSMVYRRPWEKNESVKQVVFKVSVNDYN